MSLILGPLSLDQPIADQEVHAQALGARLFIMIARVDHILNEALALAAEERSALALALLESLETSADPKISEAWREEIRRRRIALRAGATQPAPWSDARARLHSL
jgi:putative addiction module component (TIGR02574 family)